MSEDKNIVVKVDGSDKCFELDYKPLNQFKACHFYIKKEILEKVNAEFKVKKKKKYLLINELISTGLDSAKEDFSMSVNDISFDSITTDKNYQRVKIYLSKNSLEQYKTLFNAKMKSFHISKLLEIGCNEIINN